MKRNIIFRASALILVMFLLMQFVSCESYPRKILSDEGDGESQTIVLLKDGEPRCNLVVSTEVMDRLLSENRNTLNKITRYFNILSDDSVDSNIIYINSHISKYMEGFTAYDKNTYINAKKNLKMDLLNQLKYRDYYIAVEDKSMLVVCGSSAMIFEVLQTLYDEHIIRGVEKDGKYMINAPRIGIYNGSYLKGVGIAGNPIRDYSILYPSVIYSSEGGTAAKYLYDYFYENCGVDLPLMFNDSSMGRDNQYEIIVGNSKKNLSASYYSQKPELSDYKIVQSEDKLYIMGGSDWSMQYAMDIVIRNYFSQGLSVPENYTLSGTTYGEYLFEKYSGSNLRIMSQNIWNNDVNTPVWSAVGLDCALSSRLKSFSNVFMAHNPDIICFQEIKHHKDLEKLLQMMNNKGRDYKMITCKQKVNYTPLVYNASTLTLLDSGYHKFGYGSDSSSKSYTWGYFKHNETGKTFVAISTHLWWMNTSQHRNSVKYREKQLKEISTHMDKLIEKYDCPCFVAGDFNCRVGDSEYIASLKNNFADCHDIATDFADNSSGLFSCSPFVYSNQPRVGSYKNAIDHAWVKNIKDSKVIAYDYVTPNFYGKLSDHSPICLDISL